jgi:NADPH:quinone reductase-like Zn-dependent oxidoreductase
MKSVVLCGGMPRGGSGLLDSVETVKIQGIPLTFGRIEVATPKFDPEALGNRFAALVRVEAFSCNYRDKSLMLSWSQNSSVGSYLFVGSEFSGEVLAVGEGVTSIREGDRVVANNQYPNSGVRGVRPGIPTNHASARYLVLHQAKLAKVPPAMGSEVAAAFSIGAQTAYSMLRKLKPAPNSRALVTAARSNTSLFVTRALRKRAVDVYGTSTSSWSRREIDKLGLKEVVRVDPTLEQFSDDERLRTITSEIGGFDYVVDPFFDLHVSKVTSVMKHNAKYVTCGLYDQHSHITGEPIQHKGKGLQEVMADVFLKNLGIVGNCLGQAEDLSDALADYASGVFEITVDSVYCGQQVGTFFDRTYNARDRLGKVVYRYAEGS